MVTFSMWILLVPCLLSASQEKVPIALIDVSDGDYTILVDKALQELYLYSGRSQIEMFPCSTGKNSGDKEVKGDNRTPDGIYFFEGLLDGKDLPEYYGWRAYVLNYPNSVDKIAGKDGDGIWIHGRDEPLSSMDTHGCISLTNSNLHKLATHLDAYWTPVVIREHIQYTDSNTLDSMTDSYKDFIKEWLNAWESRDIDRYRTFYSPRFCRQGRYNIDAYMLYKDKIFNKYNNIAISIDKLRIIGAGKYVLAYFLEEFAGDHIRDTGIKYIYMERNKGKPAILAEDFAGITDAKRWLAVADNLRKRQSQKMLSFLDKWMYAWETKDVEKMKTYYTDTFPNKNAFFRTKAKNLSAYKYIDVTLDDIKITRSGVYWTVAARQTFTADRYKDVGIKKLKLLLVGDRFLIRQEVWQRL
ncbi:MAG: L,D-transpeptidase family protein [Thermodesulfobacteriota bacterium]|nr:L,D-transpeptidase family protein [Thermodesulfobacteriota bacterium]